MESSVVVIALALAAMPLALSDAAEAADALLSGAIASSTGEKLGGVTVSAKAAGQTITTTVFTDETGKYYFPPLPTGTYRVWAQTLSFATAKSEVDLGANRRQDFTLVPLKDFVQQLPGDLVLASLPDATPEDRRMKALVANNCSGCHTPSFTLQHRFDEAGWTAIVDLMKRVNVSGVYGGPEHKPQGVLDRHQQELAAYLARVRGPTDNMTIKLRPRPSGETARVVFKEYDVPLAPELNVPAKDPTTDGSDWSLGTPSRRGSLVHDATADLEGNLWFTSNVPNRNTTVGRIDSKTGAVKMFR
jgi:hypothetical protein